MTGTERCSSLLVSLGGKGDRRGFGAGLGLLLLVLLWFGMLPTGQAAALSGPQKITFGEYGEGTTVSTQYEGQGVIFQEEDGDGYPYIDWDGASDENPVLAGPFGFGSTIKAEFVEPGTILPQSVENLNMDVGYIDEPGSTVLTVETSTGPHDLYADDYGFNHLSLTAANILGFRVENVGYEEAGWEIDNLEYTLPASPTITQSPIAPAPPPTGDPTACPSVNGPIWKQVLALYGCKTMQKTKCEIALAMNFPDVKWLKGADGLYDLVKVAQKDKGLLPAARLYNRIYSIKLLPGAPKGFQTAGQIRDKLEGIHEVSDAIKMLPDLKKAMNREDFAAIFNLMVDFLGVRPCVDLITSW